MNESLEMVLADITALGYIWALSRHADGKCYLSTWRDGVDVDLPEAHWMHSSGRELLSLAETHRESINAAMAPETRWNVWAKGSDGFAWAQVNSNLNIEQASCAVERLSRAPMNAGVTFEALPIGQVPGGPPVDAADRLLFLNQDPEVQPIPSTDRDAEKALARADRERETAASEREGE